MSGAAIHIPCACPECGSKFGVIHFSNASSGADPFAPPSELGAGIHVGSEITIGTSRARVESIKDVTPRDEAGKPTGWPAFTVTAIGL